MEILFSRKNNPNGVKCNSVFEILCSDLNEKDLEIANTIDNPNIVSKAIAGNELIRGHLEECKRIRSAYMEEIERIFNDG